MGDGRRLRGDALGRARPRPGTGGSTRNVVGAARARRRSASWRRSTRPASAAGPALRELVARLRGRARRDHARRAARAARCAEAQRYEGWLVRSFFEGAARRCGGSSRTGSRPTSRGSPTRRRRAAALALAGTGASLRDARAARRAAACSICGWEGDATAIGRRRAAAARAAARGGRALRRRSGRARVGALALRRPAPARRPARPRRAGRDARDRDTWSEPRAALHDAVARARCRGLHVGCHVSHLYPTGASLYFTVLGRRDATTRSAQWRALKAAAARRDRRRRRHDHPPPRGRPRPRAVAGRRGRRRSGSSCCARSRSAATPPGS